MEIRMGLAFDEQQLRFLGYQVIDEVTDYLIHVRERPVWQPMPDAVCNVLETQSLPLEGDNFEDIKAPCPRYPA